MTVGIRDLKARLSGYMEQVKGGATIIITERGKPIGRIVPPLLTAEARLQELVQAGLVSWNGQRLGPALTSMPRTRGEKTVADLLLEDRE